MPIENGPVANTKKTPTKAVPAADFQEPTAPDVDSAKESDAVKSDPRPSEVKAGEDDFIFVRMPDNTVRAVRNDAIQNIGQFDSTAGVPEVPEQDVYVWLADGSVERMPERDLPGAAGTNAAHGHYVRDGHTFLIVAVHPVETENPKN